MHPELRMSTHPIDLAAQDQATDAVGLLVRQHRQPEALLATLASLQRAGQPREVAAAQTEVAESLDPRPPTD